MAQSVEDKLVVRMEATLRQFERQMERGRKAAETSAKGSEQAWKRAGDQMAANSNRAATGLQRLTSIGGQGRFVLQNTANQIGDIAVQMNSGTSAGRALGQQLPQLFGGFAALGGSLGVLGPLLGTVAALGIPVAMALLSTGDAAESLDDRLKALKESISAVNAAQGMASISASDLVRDYGSLADEAREIFEINRQIATVRASDALDSAARGIAGQLGVEGVFGFGPDEVRDLEGTLKGLKAELNAMPKLAPDDTDTDAFARWVNQTEALQQRIAHIGSAQDNIKSLAKEFGITRDQAREVLAQFAAIGQAQGPREQAQALSDLANYINGVSENLSNATEDGEALYDALLQAVVQALELAKVDIAGNIADGRAEAEGLKNELAAALALFNRIGSQSSKTYSGRGGDPRDFEAGGSRSGYESALGYETVDEIIKRYSKTTKRSRGGGRGAPEGLREAEQLFEQTRTKAEKYAAEVERINELHRMFPEIITTEVRDRALTALNEAVVGVEDMTERLERGFEDAFAAFVTGAGSARDAARSLAADLAKMFARRAFDGLNLFGGGGLFGKGGLLGGLLSFDGGGFTGSGSRSGGVDGRGGFPAILHPNETVIDHTRASSGASITASTGGGIGRVEIVLRTDEGVVMQHATKAAGVAIRQERGGIVQEAVATTSELSRYGSKSIMGIR